MMRYRINHGPSIINRAITNLQPKDKNMLSLLLLPLVSAICPALREFFTVVQNYC